MLVLDILYLPEMLSLDVKFGPLLSVTVGFESVDLVLEESVVLEYLVLVGLVLGDLVVHLHRGLLDVLLQLRSFLLAVMHQCLTALNVTLHVLQNVKTGRHCRQL